MQGDLETLESITAGQTTISAPRKFSRPVMINDLQAIQTSRASSNTNVPSSLYTSLLQDHESGECGKEISAVMVL